MFLSQLGDSYRLIDYTVLEALNDDDLRVDIETVWDGSSSHRRFITWVHHRRASFEILQEEAAYQDPDKAKDGHGLCVAQWRRAEHVIIRSVPPERAEGERRFWRR